MENEAQVVDHVDEGDFGAGTGSLESQLMDSIKDMPDETIEDQAGAEVTDTELTDSGSEGTPVEAAPEVEVPLFDAEGKFTLKVGDKLTENQIKELNRSWFRESDYTRKTQEIAQVRKEAEEILQTRDAILQDPKNLRQVFEDQHIMSAFSKPELLNLGLAGAGVAPKTWNTFLAWLKDNDELPRGERVPEADPYVEHLSRFERRIAQLENNLTAGEQKRLEAEIEKQKAAEESQFLTEVDGALSKFPNVKKRALLVEMAASDGTKTVEQLAKALNDEIEGRFNEYLKTKTKHKETVGRPTKGTAVPIMRKAPESFEEAREMVAGMYGTGGLKGSESFE